VKILAISYNRADPTPHIKEELRRIAELREAGILDELWLKADRSGAVIVLEADDAEDAQRQLATLPLVAHGITTFEVTELVAVDSAR
jgi:muconolactone delta-isomerase